MKRRLSRLPIKKEVPFTWSIIPDGIQGMTNGCGGNVLQRILVTIGQGKVDPTGVAVAVKMQQRLKAT